MRSYAPSLLPILRSRHQAEMLTVLLLHPERSFTLTDLAGLLKLPALTLHRDVERLLEAELITATNVGRARLLQANAANRLIEPLTHLVVSAFGPHQVIAEEFADVGGVDLVLIYGSWAARYHDVPGPPPNDIDVMVVGQPKRIDVYEAAERAADRIGFPVNPTIRSLARWRAADDALVRDVRHSETVTVIEQEMIDESMEPRRGSDRAAAASR